MNFKERLQKVKCFVFDIDGVLTDGQLHILQDGTMLRVMNIKDGYALRQAFLKNYPIFAHFLQKRLLLCRKKGMKNTLNF